MALSHANYFVGRLQTKREAEKVAASISDEHGGSKSEIVQTIKRQRPS